MKLDSSFWVIAAFFNGCLFASAVWVFLLLGSDLFRQIRDVGSVEKKCSNLEND